VLSHYLLIMKRSSAPSLICRHPYISLGPIKKKLAPLFPFSPTTTELSLPQQTLLAAQTNPAAPALSWSWQNGKRKISEPRPYPSLSSRRDRGHRTP
jgi:hypothetical protein